MVLSQFNGTLNILSSALVSGNTYSFTGFFNNTSSSYTSNQSQVNDNIYVSTGTAVARLVIASITNNAGGIIAGTFQDVDNVLSAPPSGVAAIMRETATKDYPLFVDGISRDLQSAIRSHFTMLVEQGAGNNIYNSNGTISANRTVTGGGRTLTFGTSLTDLTDFRVNSANIRMDGGATVRTQINVGTIGNLATEDTATGNINSINLGSGKTLIQAVNSGVNTSNAKLELEREKVTFLGNSSSNVAWSYEMPRATPSTTNGAKQAIVWTGNGTLATPAFENLLSIQEYVSNDAVIVATGAGVTCVKASGTATVTVPANVALLHISIKGVTADLAGDNSFSVVIDTTSTVSNQGTSTMKIPQFQIINTASQIGGGPSASLPFIYDEGAAPQRQVTNLASGNVTLRAINLDAFSNWTLAINP